QLDRDLADAEKAIFDSQRALEEDQLQRETLSEELMMLEPELEMLLAEQEESALRLLEAEEAQARWQDDWDAFTQRASEPTRQAEVAQTRMQATEQQLARLDQQIRRLQEELQQLQDNPEREEIQLLAEEVSEQELQATLPEQTQSAREPLEALRSQRDDGKARLSQMLNRKATLDALQKAALGQGSDAVSHWLDSHQLARKPRLAEQLQVEAGWERAVETVLGDYLQAVMIDQLDPAQHWLGSFKEGQLTLWQNQPTSGNTAATGSLLAKVQSKQDISGLLAGVKTAPDLAQALAMRVSLNAEESVITPDGIWLGRSWLRVAKAADGEGGVLARQQELEVLDDQIEELDIQVEEWDADLDAAQLRQRSLEQQRDTAQREQQQVAQKLITLKSQLSGKQARAEQFDLRGDKLRTEVAELQELQALEGEQLELLRLQWQEAVSAIDTDTDERERLQTRRQQVQQQLEQ